MFRLLIENLQVTVKSFLQGQFLPLCLAWNNMKSPKSCAVELTETWKQLCHYISKSVRGVTFRRFYLGMLPTKQTLHPLTAALNPVLGHPFLLVKTFTLGTICANWHPHVKQRMAYWKDLDLYSICPCLCNIQSDLLGCRWNGSLG